MDTRAFLPTKTKRKPFLKFINNTGKMKKPARRAGFS